MPKTIKSVLQESQKRLEKSVEFNKLRELSENRKKIDLQIEKLTQKITLEYSPYQKNMKIIYQYLSDPQSWIRHGIIQRVVGNEPDGLDGFWELHIKPCTSAFNPYAGKKGVFIIGGNCRILKIVG